MSKSKRSKRTKKTSKDLWLLSSEVRCYYCNEIKRLKELSRYYSENDMDNSMVNYQIKMYEQKLYAHKTKKQCKTKNADDVDKGLNIYYPSYKRGKTIIR